MTKEQIESMYNDNTYGNDKGMSLYHFTNCINQVEKATRSACIDVLLHRDSYPSYANNNDVSDLINAMLNIEVKL